MGFFHFFIKYWELFNIFIIFLEFLIVFLVTYFVFYLTLNPMHNQLYLFYLYLEEAISFYYVLQPEFKYAH